MTQPTNIEKAIETALAKCTNEEGLIDIGKYDHDLLREIVTSTYLRVIEDCEKFLKEEIEPCDEYEEGCFTCELYKKLQSLKQTKDEDKIELTEKQKQGLKNLANL